MTSGIRRLIIAQVMRTLFFAGPISVLFLLAKGLTIPQALALTSIVLVSGMIFEIPTGVFSDKYGRKWGMIAGSALSVIGWAMWLYADTFAAFAVINIIFGAANAFWSGSDHALIYDELRHAGREKEAKKAFSYYDGALAGAFAVSALIGGIVASTHTLAIFYLLYKMTLLTSLAGFFLTFFIQETREAPSNVSSHEPQQGLVEQFSIGIRLLQKNAKLRKITFFSILTLSFALMDLYQIFFTHSRVPEVWYGYVLALSSLLIGVAKWNAYKLEEYLGVERSMRLLSILPAFFWIAMALFVHPAIAVALFLLNDVTGNMRDPIIADYQNRHIMKRNRATVLSTIALLTNVYMAVMLPVVGFIAGKNLNAAFLFAAILIFLGNLLFQVRADDVVVMVEKFKDA